MSCVLLANAASGTTNILGQMRGSLKALSTRSLRLFEGLVSWTKLDRHLKTPTLTQVGYGSAPNRCESKAIVHDYEDISFPCGSLLLT
mmetsp:Transcript_92646/g.146469  ORF Transcript_92646/g.146469 Transcript_92646/m.146469 type:complete len:88 (+) Transcript_92646:491-754(+)